MMAVLFSTTAYAGSGNIQFCENCNVFYQKKVVRQAPRYAVPVAPIPDVPVPVQPVAPGFFANIYGQIFSAPYDQQPVAITPSGRCATYVDPYDLFGQLFGNPDLVQSCW